MTKGLFSFREKYGPDTQWADPVTGSSSIPALGPKKRLKKSGSGSVEIVDKDETGGAMQHKMTPR